MNFLAAKLATKDLINSRVFALTFILNLSLGLLGFLTIDTFKRSITEYLEFRSKSVLAADLSASARRPLTPDELQKIASTLPADTLQRSQISMISMVASPTESRLSLVVGIDEQFPFYGELELGNGKKVSSSTPKELVDEPVAWIYPELLVQLGLELGQSLDIGSQTFKVTTTVDKDPSMSAAAFMIAPKVFVGQEFLKETGLIQTGSRVTYSWLYKFPATASDIDIEEVQSKIRQVLPATDVRIRTHKKASEQLARVLIYLNDYLGLVALVAMFLAAVGSTYLFRSYVNKKSKDIAILLSLGVSRFTILTNYVLQVLILGSLAAIGSSVLLIVSVPLLTSALGSLLFSDLSLSVSSMSVVYTIVVGCVGALLVCLPLLARISRMQPSQLFREASGTVFSISGRSVLYWVPAGLLFWFLAMWQAQSFLTGTMFLGIFTVAAVLLLSTANTVASLSTGVWSRTSFMIRMAGLNLVRKRTATLSSFAAIGIGALLVNLIPQLRAVLDQELNPVDDSRPGLFMFDIQDEQLDELRTITGAAGAPMGNVSPMIRARYLAKNGVQVATEDESSTVTREDERRSSMENRTFNLSYRGELSSAEEIIAGEPFSKTTFDFDSSEPAEMSLEVRFADRIGAKIGDIMEFDVQGVTVAGKIVNLRSVKWNSFQPNFFVQFQPGVLEDAPKSIVASIPPLAFNEKISLQQKIVKVFPNVSIVDVEQTVNRITDIIDQMGKAVRFMALLTLVAGLAVLFSIARHQTWERTRDVHLLKILGTSHGTILMSTIFEFVFLSSLATLLGCGISIGAGAILAQFVFKSPVTIDWMTPIYSGFGVVAVSSLVGLFAAWRSLQKPSGLVVKQG